MHRRLCEKSAVGLGGDDENHLRFISLPEKMDVNEGSRLPGTEEKIRYTAAVNTRTSRCFPNAQPIVRSKWSLFVTFLYH